MLYTLFNHLTESSVFDYVIDYASYIAVVAYAISGAIIGIQKKFDILGVFFIALINSISGGIIRDLLADSIPELLLNTVYIYLIILSTIIVILLRLYRVYLDIDGKIYVICDALGLASFSIIGGMVAIERDFNLVSILLFSMITAIGGSMVRDVILNKIPEVLRIDFYATISLIIGFILFVLNNFSILNDFSATILLCFGVVLRLTAHWKKWKLPII